MNGMATLLAQARTLETLTQQKLVQQAMPLDDVVQKVIAPLSMRAVVAERKLANVERVLEYFSLQAKVVPPDHPQRQVVETMISTLRDVVAAVDKQLSEENQTKD